MNRAQTIALAVAAANLALVLCFPPYDYLSLARGNVPTFAGFEFVFGNHPNRALNINFLTLEVIVVLINACIAWLLLRGRLVSKKAVGINRYQRGVLWLVGINLLAMLLFPPFENFAAITKATLPTFEGFYFIFGDNSQRQIVTTILYIEFALALINGGLLWLLFKNRGVEDMSPEQIRALAQKMRHSQAR